MNLIVKMIRSKKKKFTNLKQFSELTTGTTRESDPSVLARDFSGNSQDLSTITTIAEPDFGKIDLIVAVIFLNLI